MFSCYGDQETASRKVKKLVQGHTADVRDKHCPHAADSESFILDTITLNAFLTIPGNLIVGLDMWVGEGAKTGYHVGIFTPIQCIFKPNDNHPRVFSSSIGVKFTEIKAEANYSNREDSLRNLTLKSAEESTQPLGGSPGHEAAVPEKGTPGTFHGKLQPRPGKGLS